MLFGQNLTRPHLPIIIMTHQGLCLSKHNYNLLTNIFVGYSYTRSTNIKWRKNRSKRGSCQENEDVGQGVDLNRNFGSSWKPVEDQCSSNYPGPKAFSEPESAAIRDTLLPVKERLLMFQSVHTSGRVWVFPNQPQKGMELLKRVLR